MALQPDARWTAWLASGVERDRTIRRRWRYGGVLVAAAIAVMYLSYLGLR